MTEAQAAKQWLGHPRGLFTLFFTEMWERASYYGMRALLVLYMTGSVMQPGLGFPDAKATKIYSLYTRDDPRRDSGFSLFYMGINTGAFFAPLVTGWLGQKINWHIGFAAAGVGMVFGLIQYVMGQKYLIPAEEQPTPQTVAVESV